MQHSHKDTDRQPHRHRHTCTLGNRLSGRFPRGCALTYHSYTIIEMLGSSSRSLFFNTSSQCTQSGYHLLTGSVLDEHWKVDETHQQKVQLFSLKMTLLFLHVLWSAQILAAQISLHKWSKALVTVGSSPLTVHCKPIDTISLQLTFPCTETIATRAEL